MIIRPDRLCASCGTAEREISSYCRPCSRKNVNVCTRKSDEWRIYKNLKVEKAISKEEWFYLVSKHGWKCDICDSSERVGVDQNHNTGAIHGILCRRCRLGIGNFHDDPELLRAAAKHLEREINITVEIADEKVRSV